MTIDIQSLPGGLVQNAGDAAQPAQNQTPAIGQTDTGARRGPDTVSLTDSASRLQHLESSLNNLPVVDTQRVEGVQLQLATGTFSVDPMSSADKLLEMERNLP